MIRQCLTAVGLLLVLTASPASSANYTSPPGVSQNSINPGVLAAGTTLATGTTLISDKNVITTCASGAGVVLSGVPGQTQEVWNNGASACLVYPPTLTQSINGGAVGAAVSLATGFGHGSFTCLSATLCVQAP